MEHTTSTSDCDDNSSVVTHEQQQEGSREGNVVEEPTDSDVLCGRGGSINSHSGNERFRTLVERRKRVYLTARFKREKRLIAGSIVSEIRALDPPGRFLTRDSKSNQWKDIGDEKARDKTSQALRENAPSIRAEIEIEIKEQRAEMQRVEEAEAARHPYYNNGWGFHSYYGYGHHPPPPHGHPPPPPPPGYYDGGWGPYPPPYTSATSTQGGPYPPPAPKSTLQQTADILTSGAESIKSWTKTSFLGGGGAGVFTSSSNDCQDANSRTGSVVSATSKPIMYLHDAKRRRMVKFREDSKGGGRLRPNRPTYSPVHSANNSVAGSIADHEEEDIEPHNIESSIGEQDSSFMTQVANHILSSIGSWEASTIACGNENLEERIPLPNNTEQYEEEFEEQMPEEQMTAEWEGQEVLLVEKNEECKRPPPSQRMPPPVARRPFADAASSVGFSSLGSCHSWLPEIAGPNSIFGNSMGDGISPAASMEMEYSSGNFSAGGSIGGESFTGVFENGMTEPDPMPSMSVASAGHMSNRVLNQVPSWERSLRNKSPLSLGSDDESLVSMESTRSGKISDAGTLSPIGNAANGMVWESRE